MTLQLQHEIPQILHNLIFVWEKFAGLPNVLCMGGIKIPQIILIPVAQLPKILLKSIPPSVEGSGVGL